MNIDQLNRLSVADAATAFEQCCGASEWTERMVFSRPFESLGEVLETSDTIWEECDVDDYEEAFSFHPRIGELSEEDRKRATTGQLADLGMKWAAQELKSLETSAPEVLEKLADANDEYEEKFGHIFVVSAPGKSGQELLTMLQARMGNDPKDEILIAAAEQNKITKLRLKKLLA